jgi:DHA3 family multidrug efflux protein-like MFS transporter
MSVSTHPAEGPHPKIATRTFHAVLGNTLVASVTNNFVWFAVTFWVYLQTRSVLATSVMAGIYLGTVAVSGFLLGSLVDRYPKKRVMTLSSLALSIFIPTQSLRLYLAFL